MNARFGICIALVAALVGGFAGFGIADDEPAADPMDDPMMKKLMELATPGPFHKHLDGMVGSFDCESVMMDFDGSAVETTGSARSGWVLGNRFVEMTYTGSAFGMPFEGRGIMGYDNFKKQYIGIWLDTFGTGMYVSKGTCSEDGKTLTLEGIWEGPMGKMEMKDVYTLGGADGYSIKSFMKTPDGWFEKMNLTFTRTKAKSN